jgi:hypothetical protein
MKPKMSAAQREARRKAGLSTSDPTHACSGAISNAKPDCEEKRDPDKRSLIIQKKENELDPDTQLEQQTFAAGASQECFIGRSRHSNWRRSGFVSAARKAAPRPLYRISVTRRMAAITREPKTFNNCLGFEQAL